MPNDNEFDRSAQGAATMGIIGMVILFAFGAKWYWAVWFWIGNWLGAQVRWREARLGAGEYGGNVSLVLTLSAWIAGVVGFVSRH